MTAFVSGAAIGSALTFLALVGAVVLACRWALKKLLG